MRASLSHLPQDKQDELRHVTELIREAADPEMIILFGSHARGDWVEDRHEEDGVLYEYVSDYDILLVVKSREHGASCRLWQQVERMVREKLPAGSHVNAIAHNIDHVNQKLSEGHYFFTDIVMEGVLLYDSGRYELAEAKELDAEERRRVAEEHFDQWFPSAVDFFDQFTLALGREKCKLAAFELHQAAERFYTTILLVFNGHKPKTHDLEKLSRLATAHVSELVRVFPRMTDEEMARFELLNRAYIDARYKPDYSITREDLEYLASRVAELKALTESSCREKMAGWGG